MKTQHNTVVRIAFAITIFFCFTWLGGTPLTAATNQASDDFRANAATRAARNKSNILLRVSIGSAGDLEKAKRLGTIIKDYGSFVVLAAVPVAERLNDGLEKIRLETEINLPGARFEPLGEGAGRSVNFKSGEAEYFIVQFAAPVVDEWLNSVREAGAEIIQYIPHNAFFVYATPAAMQRIAAHSRVRWTGRYLPTDKISRVLSAQLNHARNGANLSSDITPLELKAGGASVFEVAVFARADLDAAANEIAARTGGKIVSVSKLPLNYFNLVQIELPLDRVNEVVKLRDVVTIEAFITPRIEDERSSQIIAGNYTSTTVISPPGYNPLTQFGVNGNNVTIGMVDDGVGIPGDGGFYVTAANTVNALSGATAGAAGHGHLNATIISGTTPFSTMLDPTGYNYGFGVAPASHEINIPFLRSGYTGGRAQTVNDTVETMGPNGVLGSMNNNSWGSGTNGNVYGTQEAEYDGFVRDASFASTVDPLLVIFSAGNSGVSGLTRPKMSKNTIATAASENLRPELGGTAANNMDDIASFSSRGPAADTRIKPDIAAPGTSVSGGRSGTSAMDGNIDTFHRRSSGTSHAAPQITGAAALFTQFWKNGHGGQNPSPAVVKAALINSTVEINGVGSSATITNGSEGWGRLNMKGMLNTGFPIQYINQTTEFLNVGDNTSISGTVADASKPVRVTLVWTDPPGTVDPALVNNLDLTVTIGANVYRGNVFSNGISVTGGAADIRNNVENVFLPAGTTGAATVQVSATALNGDGILGNADPTDQHFALVVSNVQTNAVANTPFDFDGDGRADIAVFRPSNGAWYLQQSTAGFAAVQFGQSGDLIVPADYDADNKTDIAVFRPSNSVWYLLRSTAGFAAAAFGTSGDIPMPGDFVGNNNADIAVFRPSNGTWYILDLDTSGFSAVQFGQSGDIPVAADYDNDGKDDIAVFRPSNGAWYLLQSTAGFAAVSFGQSGDKPAPADYVGNDRADLAVYRPSNGVWYRLDLQTSGFSAIPFGVSTDQPQPADFDGDGFADVAVFRESNGVHYLQQTTAGFAAAPFGTTGDRAIPNAYIP